MQNISLWDRMKGKYTASLIKPNKHKIIKPYDQGRYNFCTAFSAASCATYNTGRVFSDKEIHDWAMKRLGRDGGGFTRLVFESFAKDFGFRFLALKLTSPEVHKILASGFALGASINVPRRFYADAKDGVVDSKDYGSFEGPVGEKNNGHAISLIRQDGKDRLLNQWGPQTTNLYTVDMQDLIDGNSIKSQVFLIW